MRRARQACAWLAGAPAHATGAHLMDGDAAVLLKLPHGSRALPRAGRRSARAELDAAHAYLKPYLGPPWPTRCMRMLIGAHACCASLIILSGLADRQAPTGTQVQGSQSAADWRVVRRSANS